MQRYRHIRLRRYHAINRFFYGIDPEPHFGAGKPILRPCRIFISASLIFVFMLLKKRPEIRIGGCARLSCKRFAWACFMSFLPWFCSLAGAQVSVSAKLDSANIQLGNTTALRIQLHSSIDTPAPQADYSALDSLSGIEVLQTLPFRPIDVPEGKGWEAEAVLIALEPGRREIGGIKIHLPDTILTPEPLSLDVLMPALTPDEGLAPIKNIVEEPVRLSDRWHLWALAALALGAAAWYVFQKRRHSASSAEAPPPAEIPAHVVALQQLKSLQQKRLWLSSHKQHYTELTDVLRTYIGRRFHIPALSETSTGILQDLSESRIAPSAGERLERILHTADLAKFAKARPAEALNIQLLDEAFRFVEETMPSHLPSTAGS